MLAASLVAEHGPEEFAEWLAEESQPEQARVADEMAFMLRAGGEIERG